MQPLLIFDKTNHTFTSPKVILKTYFNLEQDAILNGEETITFKIPVNHFLFESEDYAQLGAKKYVIKKHIKRRDDTGLYLEVTGEGLYVMLMDYYIEGEDTWLAGASVRTVLERILRNTPFTVGRCDDFGTWDIELGELNCLEALNQVRDNWPGTIEYEFDGFTVNALLVRGQDTAYQLHYNKNLVDIERIADTTGLCTRLVGLGEDGLTIEGLAESKVKDSEGVHLSGGKVVAKYIDAPNINEFSHPKMYYENFSDISDQAQLLVAMQKSLNQKCKPILTYTATFSEMVRQGVPYSDINVGDFVYINDEEFGQIKLRIAEINKDTFNIEHSTVTLGERYRTLEDYLSDFDASKNIWEELGGGKLDGILEQAIADATKWLNNGQNTCFITENDGIICADTTTLGPGGLIQNHTRLIKMASGAIGCSVDGGQSYRSAMTPEGVVADSIIGGRIHSSHITVGDESLFEDGYKPEEVRRPLAVEFENLKDATGSIIGGMNSELNILNQAVSQTTTAMDLLSEDLKAQVDILSQDVSGLNGDYQTMEKMYDNVNSMLFTNSYFRWTAQGIHAIDTGDPRYQMLLSSKGLGFSTNSGLVFENAITARGIVASQVNIGTFGEKPFKGLTIRNGLGEETFAIDTNGNVSLMGNLNMQGGSINWKNISKVTYDALDPTMRDKFTWIDSGGVYTGIVKTKQLVLDGPFEVTKDGVTTFLISQDGSVYMNGSIHLGAGSVIDWTNTNIPTLDDVGAASAEDIEAYKAQMSKRLTQITEDGIYTGTIDAGKIVVTGDKIPGSVVDITLTDLGGASLDELNEWAITTGNNLSALNKKIPTSEQITEITNSSIKTATISANQILGGEIAGVQIYCDDKIIIGRKFNSTEPRIIFAPDDEYTAITYKTNELGESYLGIQSDNGMSIYTKNSMKITAQQILDIASPFINLTSTDTIKLKAAKQIILDAPSVIINGQTGGVPGVGDGAGGGVDGVITGGDNTLDYVTYAKNITINVLEDYNLNVGHAFNFVSTQGQYIKTNRDVNGDMHISGSKVSIKATSSIMPLSLNSNNAITMNGKSYISLDSSEDISLNTRRSINLTTATGEGDIYPDINLTAGLNGSINLTTGEGKYSRPINFITGLKNIRFAHDKNYSRGAGSMNMWDILSKINEIAVAVGIEPLYLTDIENEL